MGSLKQREPSQKLILKCLADEKNVEQLHRQAQLKRYLDVYYKDKLLGDAMQPGYPQETPERTLVIHMQYLLTTKGGSDAVRLARTEADVPSHVFLCPQTNSSKKVCKKLQSASSS